MWQLHKQGAGGIVGDEMGLGKTVQVWCVDKRALGLVSSLNISLLYAYMSNARLLFQLRTSILECRGFGDEAFVAPILTAPYLGTPIPGQVAAFLGALHDSNVMRQALILCPATVLSHWMAELHAWAPQLRVVVLHRCVQAFNAASGSSGTGRACGSLPWRSRSLRSFGWLRQESNDSCRGLAPHSVDPHPHPAKLSNLFCCGRYSHRKTPRFDPANLKLAWRCRSDVVRRSEDFECAAFTVQLGLLHSGRGAAYPQSGRKGNGDGGRFDAS